MTYEQLGGMRWFDFIADDDDAQKYCGVQFDENKKNETLNQNETLKVPKNACEIKANRIRNSWIRDSRESKAQFRGQEI